MRAFRNSKKQSISQLRKLFPLSPRCPGKNLSIGVILNTRDRGKGLFCC
jgi:hypothetical protein